MKNRYRVLTIHTPNIIYIKINKLPISSYVLEEEMLKIIFSVLSVISMDAIKNNRSISTFTAPFLVTSYSYFLKRSKK